MNRLERRISGVLILFAAGLLASGCSVGFLQPEAAPTPTLTPRPPTATPEDTPEPSPAPAAVALSPASGPPGTELQVTAAGLPPESEIEVGLGRQGSEVDLWSTSQSDAEGGLVTALGVPTSAQPGEAWVVVVTAGEEASRGVSNPFHVTEPTYDPTASISPSSGPSGTMMELEAEGFPPEELLEIGVGLEASEYDVVDTLQAGSDGALTTQVRIPGYADVGERWVVVVTTEDRSADAVSNVFVVEEMAYEGAVTIAPTSGTPGTRVAVTAEGFPPNARMQIGVGRVDSEYDVVATAWTNGEGRVETEIVMPSFLEPDDRWVIVVAADRLPVKAVSEEFDVVAAATPTPGAQLFDSTNIYLIAIGDEGRSGREIGCNDSVVPVEVAIEPTAAPLGAALRELLSIGTREYGMSGYYNALHASRLTLERVTIEDGEAVIRLSGTLQLGGVCDEPRVRAQLEHTALQFSTVDEVSIFIDGTPLDELLGEG